MSDETTLLSCPFCGGEASVKVLEYDDDCKVWGVFCESDLADEYSHGHFVDNYATEAEAIAAWNSRADYHGYEQAAIEAWESIKAWNSRAERTCKNKSKSCTSFWCSKSADLIHEYYKPMVAELQAKVDRLTAERDELKGQVFTLKCECDDLENERDKLQEQLRIGWECECRLQAERDKFKEANDYHAAQYELASEDCDRLQVQVDELKAERVKLRSQICKLEDDLVRANDENKHVSFADRIRFVNEIDELKTERDNLKANNEQLHMLAGEQAAKIDELQSAFDAICANLSIIATGEPNVIADIAIATIEALIDQCNEYREKFGKCIDYADAIHALMDDEGMA